MRVLHEIPESRRKADAAAVDRMARAEPEEPLSPESIAMLVRAFAAATGESFERCFLRIVSRAVILELMERCCPE